MMEEPRGWPIISLKKSESLDAGTWSTDLSWFIPAIQGVADDFRTLWCLSAVPTVEVFVENVAKHIIDHPEWFIAKSKQVTSDEVMRVNWYMGMISRVQLYYIMYFRL